MSQEPGIGASSLRGSVAKWCGWLLAIMLVSMMVGAARFLPLESADRAFTIPAHATSGLLTALIAAATLLAASRRVISAQDSQRAALQSKIGRAVILLTLTQAALGMATAAFSPLAIRILYSEFNLSSLASANVGTQAIFRALHFLNASLLVVASLAFIGVVLWRQFAHRDGALVRLLPFSGLWARLRAEEAARSERFPSLRPNGWAKGRLS